MLERPTVDVAAIIEGQRLTPFLVRLVVLSWIVTFFDGFDMNAISFAAPVIRSTLGLSQAMMGKVFSFGLIGTMIGGFLLGWLGDASAGGRPSSWRRRASALSPSLSRWRGAMRRC